MVISGVVCVLSIGLWFLLVSTFVFAISISGGAQGSLRAELFTIPIFLACGIVFLTSLSVLLLSLLRLEKMVKLMILFGLAPALFFVFITLTSIILDFSQFYIIDTVLSVVLVVGITFGANKILSKVFH